MYHISTSAGVAVAVAMTKTFNLERASNSNFGPFLKTDHSRLMMRPLAIILIQDKQERRGSCETIELKSSGFANIDTIQEYLVKEKPMPTNASNTRH
jgi:hypothetical protein